jgi:poly-beta-1,6-N-acetyl-D-glucosamine N-deacetylase
MYVRIFKVAMIVFLLIWPIPGQGAEKYLALCYHDIPEVATAPEDVPQHIFVKHIEYLRTHGYVFIGAADAREAQRGGKSLPEKAVLLTFDDAYVSFHQFVLPVLKMYKIPSVLSVAASWIEKKPDYVGKSLMSWDQIREAHRSGWVEIATHTYDLHQGIPYNAAGNVGPASALFLFDPRTKQSEDDFSFKQRLRADLALSLQTFEKEIGERPRVLAWPFGKFNHLGMEEARALGLEMMLTLENGPARVSRPEAANRNMITSEMSLKDFISSLQKGFEEPPRIRAAQVDLDLIVNPASYEESDQNLGLLIDRLVALGVNTIFLQGFCDTEGSGNIRSVYFPNRVLPVKMDFLSHAVHQIKIRGIQTYVWMPALSFELPDSALNDRLKVQEIKNGKKGPTTSWYRRLSPFDPKTLEIIKSLYRDLATGVYLDGILFQDDLYLTDEEDFHPEARKAFQEKYGFEPTPERLKEKPVWENWIALKTFVLNRFTQDLMETVRPYRPAAAFARNIYSAAVLNPEARDWFSQNLEDYLRLYDYAVIMAYPQMEGIRGKRPILSWHEKLWTSVKKTQGQDKVIFKVQSFDWAKKEWIAEGLLEKELKHLLALGARHVGYYPDNVYEKRPSLKIGDAISARKLP